jgi:hypothetical protein
MFNTRFYARLWRFLQPFIASQNVRQHQHSKNNPPGTFERTQRLWFNGVICVCDRTIHTAAIEQRQQDGKK